MPPVPPANDPLSGNANPPRHDRALAALQRMARPQPKAPQGREAPPPEAGISSGSATGFVGMLARPPAEAGDRSVVTGFPLQMAREIPVLAPRDPGEAALVPPDRGSPLAENPLVVWGVCVLVVILMFIGFWSVGALVYMGVARPAAPDEVGYPLLAWRFEVGPAGGYTLTSRMMAWGMLLCLPVAFLLLVTLLSLRRPGRRQGSPGTGASGRG